VPTFEVIKASEAPGVPKKQSKYATALLTAISGLKKDEVLKLSADPGKSLRGVKTGVGRVTKSAGVNVTTYDDGQYVYVVRG
jgi:hypothetical protein